MDNKKTFKNTELIVIKTGRTGKAKDGKTVFFHREETRRDAKRREGRQKHLKKDF